MKLFALTKAAKADLTAIAVLNEKCWGREQRNLYLKQFDETFHLLANTPIAGKACDYISVGYRKFPQGSHILFYKQGTINKIEIDRILHKNMDVESLFDKAQ